MLLMIPGTGGSGPLSRTPQVSQLTLTVQAAATAPAPGPDLLEHVDVTITPPPHCLKFDIMCACLKFHISLVPERLSRRLIFRVESVCRKSV